MCDSDESDGRDDGPSQAELRPGFQRDSDSINDLGLIFGESMTDSEVSRAISGLTPGQKYSLLTKNYKPGRNFVFPKVHSNGC